MNRLVDPRFSQTDSSTGAVVSCLLPVAVREEPENENAPVDTEGEPNPGSNRHVGSFTVVLGKRSAIPVFTARSLWGGGYPIPDVKNQLSLAPAAEVIHIQRNGVSQPPY